MQENIWFTTAFDDTNEMSPLIDIIFLIFIAIKPNIYLFIFH